MNEMRNECNVYYFRLKHLSRFLCLMHLVFLVAPETPAEDPYFFPFNDVDLFLVEADLLMRTRQHFLVRFQM
jgi:hypothetical protein